MKKRGAILIGNIVFIILNLIYLTILVVFLLRYSGGTSLLEESYAKQIALVLDSVEPNMVIFLDMGEAFEAAEKKWGKEYIDKIVNIQDNQVIVKLSKDSKGYSYSFFNNIDVRYYNYSKGIDKEKGYVFNIGGYK